MQVIITRSRQLRGSISKISELANEDELLPLQYSYSIEERAFAYCGKLFDIFRSLSLVNYCA